MLSPLFTRAMWAGSNRMLESFGIASTWRQTAVAFLLLTPFCVSSLLAQARDGTVNDAPSNTSNSTDQPVSSGLNGSEPSDAAPAESSGNNALPGVSSAISTPPVAPQGWNWKASTLEAFQFTLFDHLWRAAWDPSLRYMLAHKPFYHDWFASYRGWDLKRWADGDDFVVDDVGHPLQGAVISRTYLLNNRKNLLADGLRRITRPTHLP